MLPEFPKFKKLELSDKTAIESITKRYPPYSDFNFTSMWSWDVKGDMKIAQLNGNLIVRFTDYLSGVPFYSFLGDSETSDTAQKLLVLSQEEQIETKLKLIPETSVAGIDQTKFRVKEDEDNFDYIIDVDILKEYNTSKTKSRKRATAQFIKDHPTHSIDLIDLSETTSKAKIISLLKKIDADNPKNVAEKEFLAVMRFLDTHKELKCFTLGVSLKGELIGIYIGELIHSHYATGHFWKVDTSISPGLYAYLMQKAAQHVAYLGYKFVNIEQDLGIENLRKWKTSYGSKTYLKKYTIVFK